MPIFTGKIMAPWGVCVGHAGSSSTPISIRILGRTVFCSTKGVCVPLHCIQPKPSVIISLHDGFKILHISRAEPIQLKSHLSIVVIPSVILTVINQCTAPRVVDLAACRRSGFLLPLKDM
jgi:hypothetical protein